ncbi:hypothetical protein [Metallosphaera hakonensis]|uniref:hypothetical protein n=1 Tax=Metallosphaera hakonensis TaxID=79601 RepID=UPI0006CF9B1A|nr:hypothetical protein [Metallosphaera hakonensis]
MFAQSRSPSLRLDLEKNQIYVLQFLKDNVIPGLFSIKGMVETSQNISEASFHYSLRKTFDEIGSLGEVRTVKVRLCNDIFLFFNFNLIAKRMHSFNSEVKLLVPPLGISSSQIPYSVEGLFNSIVTSDESCSVETDFMDSRIAKITLSCKRIKVDEFRIRQSFSYFLDDMLGFRFKTRTPNPRVTEIEIVLLNLRREFLIPLLWDNFLSIYPSC